MKKTEQQTYRLSEDEKAALASVAEKLGIPAATMVGTLAAQFVKAREKHGTRLIWPPEFNYYPAGSQSMQEVTDTTADLETGSSNKRAG